MNDTDKQHMKEQDINAANESMEKTKNQNHNSKKEALGPNTRR